MPTVKTKPKKPSTKPQTEQLESVETVNGREVLYKDIRAVVCRGDKAVTEEQAKELLGWQEVTDSEYDLVDENGKKVRLHNNVGNRRFVRMNAEIIQQEILRPEKGWPEKGRHTKWQLNGETWIVGQTGSVISFQHRAVGLIFACQAWTKEPEKYPNWPNKPTMETVIVQGISESDNVVNSIDTGRPRTLADVIYRSPYFADMQSKERAVAARYADLAVRVLWRRTGFSSVEHRTHAEAVEFINNHSKIIECVKHIHDENGGSEGKVAEYISCGFAAGLMYLMASAKSDRDAYVAEDIRSEKTLDWELWDKASEFWVHLAGGHKSLTAIDEVFKAIIDKTGDKPGIDEREFVIAKAWNPLYLSDEPVTADEIEPVYDVDEEGVETLADKPICGGIDIGDFDDSMESEDESQQSPPPPAEEPTPPKKTKATKAPAQSNGKSSIKFNTSKVNKTGGRKQEVFNVKDDVWVKDDDGNWQGTITEIYDGPSGKVAKVKSAGTKKVYETAYSQLHREEP